MISAPENALQEYQDTFSDTYKDAYGVRPRFDVSHYTLQDWETCFQQLYAAISEHTRIEKIIEESAAADLEKRIAKLIEMGASDRWTAIRWIAEAEAAGEDLEYLCYLLGVPYGYFV